MSLIVDTAGLDVFVPAISGSSF